jgi:hypothetical protein
MKRLLPILLCCTFLVGCSAQNKAVQISAILADILNILKAEIPNVPASDQAGVASFVNLGLTLDGQANTCIAGAGNTKASLLNCFSVFAAGLLSPTELTQLRILSPKAQADVELGATAVIIAINGIEADWGGTALPMPTIGTPPTTSELQQLGEQLHLSPELIYIVSPSCPPVPATGSPTFSITDSTSAPGGLL